MKQNEARFVALMRKYEAITEASNEMLYAFIEKILMHALAEECSARRRKERSAVLQEAAQTYGVVTDKYNAYRVETQKVPLKGEDFRR